MSSITRSLPRISVFPALLAGILGLGSLPAEAAVTSFDIPPDLTVKQPLAKGFQAAVDKLQKKDPGSRYVRFTDGVLVVSVEPDAIRYTFERRQPMTLNDAHQVLRIMQVDPIDFAHPKKSARFIRYESVMSQATGEITAWAEIKLVKGKAAYASILQQTYTEAE